MNKIDEAANKYNKTKDPYYKDLLYKLVRERAQGRRMITYYKGKIKAYPGAEKTKVRYPAIDLKGTTFCKAKNCDNHLYKNESSSLPGYCMDCG